MLGLEKLNLNSKVEIKHFPHTTKDNTFFEEHWEELVEIEQYLNGVQDKVEAPIVTVSSPYTKEKALVDWGNHYYLVALINNAVVGVIMLYYQSNRPDTVTVNTLSVSPTHHKKGIASKLFKEVHVAIRSGAYTTPINYVLLDVAIKNKKAMSLYTKLGFKTLSSWMYLKVK